MIAKTAAPLDLRAPETSSALLRETGILGPRPAGLHGYSAQKVDACRRSFFPLKKTCRAPRSILHHCTPPLSERGLLGRQVGWRPASGTQQGKARNRIAVRGASAASDEKCEARAFEERAQRATRMRVREPWLLRSFTPKIWSGSRKLDDVSHNLFPFAD